MARVGPFRAGHVEGDRAVTQPQLMSAHASGAKVLLGDISEFQADINDAAYLQWSKAVVIRAMYGANHVDRAWRGGGRRDALHAGGARFTGIYQYVVASQDPIAQAAALVELLGSLRQGEVIIGDFEEGSGNMAEARRLWASTIHGALGDAPWSYSGEAFAAAHGLAPVEWIAAYRSSEPAAPHKLWQFTDRFTIPGVGPADCSVFHGTIDQLAGMAHQAKPEPRPAPSVRSWVSAGQMTLAALCAAELKELPSTVLRITVEATPGKVFAPALGRYIDAVFACDTEVVPAGVTFTYPGGQWVTRGELRLGALAEQLKSTPAEVLALTAVHGKDGEFSPAAAQYINDVMNRTSFKPDPGTVLHY